MNKKLPKASLFFLLAAFILGSCSSIPEIPVDGFLYNEHVKTTVDSEIARYYLESYLQGSSENPKQDERISALYAQYKKTIPTREELKVISQNYSVDFASLFLADLVLSNECNKSLNKSFAYHLKNPIATDLNVSSYQILFVPGWDYAENGRLTGSDFEKPRELASELGIENYLVKLHPTGSVENNAESLAAEITRRNRSGKTIILAGASSAGPAIHLALGELLDENEREPIKAWLNLGGILQGSPIIDYLQERPQSWLFNIVVWYKGWDKKNILSMGTAPSRTRFSRLKMDPNLLVINYLGIPLSGQVSQYSKDNYPILRPDGPNDGLTFLTDVIAPNSLTIVALGSDHFFAEDPDINKKTVALMQLIITYLENNITNKAILCGQSGVTGMMVMLAGESPVFAL